MKPLETLLTELGLTEHMEAISNWRDALLIEKAEELQQVHTDHAENVTSINEAHGTAMAALRSEKEAESQSLTEQLGAKCDGVTALEEELAAANETISQNAAQIATLQSAVSGANATLAAKNKTIQEKAAKVTELQALLDAPEKERKRLELQAQLAALDAPAPTE